MTHSERIDARIADLRASIGALGAAMERACDRRDMLRRQLALLEAARKVAGTK